MTEALKAEGKIKMNKKTVSCTVSGFAIRKYTSTEGKKEEDPGTVTLALIGSKADIRPNEALGQLNVSDVLAALNIHQESREQVEITLNFSIPEEVAKQIEAARRH